VGQPPPVCPSVDSLARQECLAYITFSLAPFRVCGGLTQILKSELRRPNPFHIVPQCPAASDECTRCPCRWGPRNHNLRREARDTPHEFPFHHNAARDNSSMPEKPSPPAVPPCSCLVPGLGQPSALLPPPAILPCSCHVLDLSRPSVDLLTRPGPAAHRLYCSRTDTQSLLVAFYHVAK